MGLSAGFVIIHQHVFYEMIQSFAHLVLTILRLSNRHPGPIVFYHFKRNQEIIDTPFGYAQGDAHQTSLTGSESTFSIL